MKYLGIDYGAKKIGIALSDQNGIMAFPHTVIENDEHTIATITTLLAEERVEGLVVGDTRTMSGQANDITNELHNFIEHLEEATHIKAILVSEAGSSGVANKSFEEGKPRGTLSSVRAQKKEAIDARAAAVILQRFLDVKK